MIRNTLISASFLLLSAGILAADARAFTLSSPELVPGRSVPIGQVFNDSGCTGGNRSPALEWRGVPNGTKSFAITMFDLDERGSPSGWWHWVVYDLPAAITRLPENAGSKKSSTLPAGAIQGRTDFGNNAYDGPCPDNGQPAHRYLITIYALKVAKLAVPPEASGAMISWSVRDYVLAKATLTSTYGR